MKEVPVYKDSQKIKYTVEEGEVIGYTGEIKETDTGFEITNTKILPLIAGDLVVLGFILKKRK